MKVTIQEEVVKVVKPSAILLEISIEQAEVLASLLGKCFSNDHSSEMFFKITDAGISYHKYDVTDRYHNPVSLNVTKK